MRIFDSFQLLRFLIKLLQQLLNKWHLPALLFFNGAGMITQLAGPLIPPSLSGPILLDRYGLPRYWTSVWSTASGGHLANSTQLKKLRSVGSLYQHADDFHGHGALDDALGTLNDNALAEILDDCGRQIHLPKRLCPGISNGIWHSFIRTFACRHIDPRNAGKFAFLYGTAASALQDMQRYGI